MRRAAHEALQKKSVKNYHPIQIKEATILVSSLLTPSADLKQDRHFKRVAASTVMSILYDYPTVLSDHDHAVEKIEKHNERLSHSLSMGSYFVDMFPWMKHIPERLRLLFFLSLSYCEQKLTDKTNRFAKWKREGLRAYAEDSEMFRSLLNRVKVDLVCAHIMCGIRNPS